MLILAISLAPILFVFTFIYLKDKYEREPLIYLIFTFILGMLICYPVVFLGDQISIFTGWNSRSQGFALAGYAIFVVALVEEGMKYAIVRIFNYNREEFDEPYDGIMYCVSASLGFAAIENILYVSESNDPLNLALLRTFTAVPAHGIFATTMGFYIGRAKFMTSDVQATLEHIKGVSLAVLFHGMYDYFLFAEWEWLALVAFVLLAVNGIVALRAIQIHEGHSPHRFEQRSSPDEMVRLDEAAQEESNLPQQETHIDDESPFKL